MSPHFERFANRVTLLVLLAAIGILALVCSAGCASTNPVRVASITSTCDAYLHQIAESEGGTNSRLVNRAVFARMLEFDFLSRDRSTVTSYFFVDDEMYERAMTKIHGERLGTCTLLDGDANEVATVATIYRTVRHVAPPTRAASSL